MNFKVFARTLFIVVVTMAVAFTVYANVAVPNERARMAEDPTTVKTEDRASANAENSGADNDGAASGDSVGTGTGSEETPEEEYIREKTEITISALGDVALGQDSRFKYTDSFDHMFEKVKGDYGYFLKNVADVLSQDDLTIANLETTLSNETEKAEKYDYGNNYWFNGKPEYANILKAGSIEVVNLANNHTYDYGPKGYEATKKALEDAGIEYFGYSEVLYKEIKGIKIGLAGFNQLGEYEQGLDMNEFKQEVEKIIKELRENSDLVIVNFHWGKEYSYEQNGLQTELAHLAIDSGADLVIGHHPHVLQPIEKYKDRYIAYSLGNFCFGGVKKPKDYDTAIFRQTFVFDSRNELQVVKAPAIIPCSVSSASGYNNYSPTIATGEQKDRIFKKLKYTPELSEEEKVAYAAKSDMVRLDIAVKDIIIDLKYATSDNITGKPVYESNIAYLRKGTAEKLDKANKILMQKYGYRIKVWDAYRAKKYQEILYNSAANKYYFADPKIGSNHTRGAAVDVTLVDTNGEELDMPSGFDEMSEKAHRTYAKATPEQKENALILENVMKSCGFIPLQKEWWHFDDSEYKSYGFIESYP